MKPIFEFHVSRQARQKYQFDETLFATDGRVVLSDFSAARRFAERIYAVSGRLVPASDIYALGLMDEILHLIIRQYRETESRRHDARFGFFAIQPGYAAR